ncbi:MAG: hypothetical protein IJ800_01530, partial [Clostridia bacterium]|nr:hypothetical protein [Clostridia bacterium]
EMSLSGLIKSTVAYKVVSREKSRDALFHAYLIVCDDSANLREYLKIFAKLIMCGQEEYCDECRVCRLIDKEVFADCTFYPAEGNKILTADVDDLVSKTYIKPFEGDKKLFVLCGAENMNPVAQNKMLKTLEEPPANTIILMGTTNEAALLPTVISRVKKLTVYPFGEEQLFKELKDDYPDEDKLKKAISLSNGSAGKAAEIYNDGKWVKMIEIARSALVDMRSSKDVLGYAAKIDRDDLPGFTMALLEEVRRLMREAAANNGEASGMKLVTIAEIGARVGKFHNDLHFNVNPVMVVDSLLFGILEEKYKWQKS